MGVAAVGQTDAHEGAELGDVVADEQVALVPDADADVVLLDLAMPVMSGLEALPLR